MSHSIPDLYAQLLRQSPPEIVAAREALGTRADHLVEEYMCRWRQCKGITSSPTLASSSSESYLSCEASPACNTSEWQEASSLYESVSCTQSSPSEKAPSAPGDVAPQRSRSALLPDSQTVDDDSILHEPQLDLDIIISGSAYRVVWFLGVHMVLSRLEAAGLIRLHRYAGASSGGKAAFQIMLTGESSTVERYLCYGLLWKDLGRAGTLSRLAWYSDKLCITEVDHMVTSSAENLPRLDNRLTISVTKLFPYPHAKLYTTWSERPEVAKQVYRATGLAYSTCDGYSASDGGATPSGAVPRYEDKKYDQLIINPWFGTDEFSLSYDVAAAIKAMEKGQDEALIFMGKSLEDPSWGGRSYSHLHSLVLERLQRLPKSYSSGTSGEVLLPGAALHDPSNSHGQSS